VHTHTLPPSILPLLEVPEEGFFWNLPEFSRRIRFDVLHGCETRPVAEKSIPVITQPPYSPDLAPGDFWLFPTLKMGLKGARFATMEDIKSNATAELRKIPKEDFRRCSQQWQDRWGKCVCAQGSYFEGDWVSVVVCPTITVLYHNSGNFLLLLVYCFK